MSDHQALVRHRRKMNKRKLRLQEKLRIERLDAQVIDLRHQTHILEDRLAESFGYACPKLVLTGIVTQAYHYLKNGWYADSANSQEMFLSQLFRPDIIFNGAVVGPLSLIEQWKRSYTQQFGFTMELVSNSVVTVPKRLVRLELNVSIASCMMQEFLQSMFPDMQSILEHNAVYQNVCTTNNLPQLGWIVHVAFDAHFKIKRLDIDPQYATALSVLSRNLQDIAEFIKYLEDKAKSRTLQL